MDFAGGMLISVSCGTDIDRQCLFFGLVAGFDTLSLSQVVRGCIGFLLMLMSLEDSWGAEGVTNSPSPRVPAFSALELSGTLHTFFPAKVNDFQ